MIIICRLIDVFRVYNSCQRSIPVTDFSYTMVIVTLYLQSSDVRY